MPVNFDLNDLYAFRALVEYGNFRVAAESICLSQSALSRRIEKLEAALGNRLFDRTTRRVALRYTGKTLLNAPRSCSTTLSQCWRMSIRSAKSGRG
jgi:DNA-binding transcriptional LysR family regulator